MAATHDATGIPLPPHSSILSAGSELVRYLLPAAIILAAAGQVVLLKARADSPALNGQLALGGGLLLLGAMAFGLAARRHRTVDSWPGAPELADAAEVYPQWLLVLMLAVAAAGAAIGIFSVAGESPVVIALWLAGMLLLILAQVKGMRVPRLRSWSRQWRYVAGVIVLLGIAIFSRGWHLTSLPLNVDGDFAAVGLQARAIALGQQTHLFAFGWASIPVLGYLPTWLSMLVFGTGLLGLNASGVIEGTLIVLGVYLLGCELFTARVGILAAALMVVSYAHMALSRQAAYVDPVCVMTWGVYFLVVGLRAMRGWAVVVAGILTALSFQVYYSGRIIIPVLGAVLLYLLLFHRVWLFSRWKALLLFTLAFLIALGPMLVLFIQHPEATMSRTQEVYVLGPEVLKHMKSVYHVDSVAGVLGQQAIRSVLFFNYFPDKGTQFALLRPFLDPFTGVLFALGAGYMLFSMRRAGSWLLMWWILLVVVVGCFLTVNAPFWPRLMILLPATMLAAALALDTTYAWLLGVLQRFGRLSLLVPVITMLAFGAVGISNWNAYVHDKADFATGRTRIARYIMQQPSTARAYLVSKGYTFQDREFEFLVPGQIVASLPPEQAEQPIAPAGAPTLLIVTPDEQELAQRLSAKYPGGPVAGNTPTEVAFYVFQLP